MGCDQTWFTQVLNEHYRATATCCHEACPISCVQYAGLGTVNDRQSKKYEDSNNKYFHYVKLILR